MDANTHDAKLDRRLGFALSSSISHDSPARTRRLVALAALSLSQLAAVDLRADEGERPLTLRLAPLPSENGSAAENAATLPLARENDPEHALIWGDNCDPTLLLQGVAPAS